MTLNNDPTDLNKWFYSNEMMVSSCWKSDILPYRSRTKIFAYLSFVFLILCHVWSNILAWNCIALELFFKNKCNAVWSNEDYKNVHDRQKVILELQTGTSKSSFSVENIAKPLVPLVSLSHESHYCSSPISIWMYVCKTCEMRIED